MYTFLYFYIRKLSSLIDAPKNLIPIVGKQNQVGKPFIEIKFPYYYLVVLENGLELTRTQYSTLDDLLYAIFDKITFDMAIQYEASNRIPNQDFRRMVFAYQLQLMERLSKRWSDKLRQRIENLLKQYPYNDSIIS